MQILRAANYKVMPWKNGMGSTTEIAIFPPQAGLDDFVWRVSMAQVAHDGPFSSFAGIDRTLLVLEGAGIDLDIEGKATVRIDRDVIHAFPGDRPTSATLVDGPIIDLNIMTRRNCLTHRVQRINVMGRQDFMVSVQTLLFVERGEVAIASSAQEKLRAQDALLTDAPMTLGLQAATAETRLIIAEFR